MEDNALALISSLSGTEITPELLKTPEFVTKYETLVDVAKYLADLKKAVDTEIKRVLRDQYMIGGDASIVADGYKYTYIPPTTRESLDTVSFKKENPDLYKQYVKISEVSDSLRTYKAKKEE